MTQRHQSGFTFSAERVDRRALKVVLITMAATSAWVGLYAGLAAKAVGVF